jgi:dATP/dGTP pyrophosphohydrolase
MMDRIERLVGHTHLHDQFLPLKVLQDAWGEWADKTFPQSDLESIASHFREEAREFAGFEHSEDDTWNVPPSHDPVEAADCLLLMLHHAHKAGYNLMEEALKKAKINIERDWDTTDEGGHGHFKHKEDPLHDAKDPTLMDVMAGVKVEEKPVSKARLRCAYVQDGSKKRCPKRADPGLTLCSIHKPYLV